MSCQASWAGAVGKPTASRALEDGERTAPSHRPGRPVHNPNGASCHGSKLALRSLLQLVLLSLASGLEPPLDPLGGATAEAAATNGGSGVRRRMDFVAVKVPTSLGETLDLALINVPRVPEKATDPPADYLMFDMSITPGNKFIALTKDGASAPSTTVKVRLAFVEDEPPQLWRLVSVGCANGTDLCARPTSSTDLADQSRRWQITRPDARLNATSDLIVSFNASGLAEDLAADAYSTELGVEVVEFNGTVRLVTLAVSTSVATEAVANHSSWGAVPPGGSCAEASLGEFAAPQVPARPDPNPTPSPNPGPGPNHVLTLTLTLTPTPSLTRCLPWWGRYNPCRSACVTSRGWRWYIHSYHFYSHCYSPTYYNPDPTTTLTRVPTLTLTTDPNPTPHPHRTPTPNQVRRLPRFTDPRFVTAELVQIQVGLTRTLT